jgi:hypothetical protein
MMQDQVEKVSKMPEVKPTYAGIGSCITLEKGTGVVSVCGNPVATHITILNLKTAN